MTVIFDESTIEKAATEFLEGVGDRRVFAFSGNLGAGKTTFIGKVCKQLGITETVSSPTYSIIQEYETDAGELVYHLDLYRLKDSFEAMEAGVEDCLQGDSKCFVEWPERAPEVFPSDTVYCDIDLLDDQKRRLNVRFS